VPEEQDRTPQSAALNDAELMGLMAFADGELSPDEAAVVQALMQRSAQAQTVVGDLRLAQRALHDDILAREQATQPLPELDDLSARVLADVTALQLMAHADGELIGERAEAAGVEALLANSGDARALVHDLELSRRALREEILSDETAQDLSMVRGRIMTRLPVEARPVVTTSESSEGIVERLRALIFGRTGLVFGVAAAAVLMFLALNQPTNQVVDEGLAAPEGPMAQLDGEPAVIIEEMEIDSGTVLVDNGLEPGAATIIWHYQDDEGEGAG